MWRRRVAVVLAVAASIVAFGLTRSASAGLAIVSQEAQVDRTDREVDFTIDFNHAPDLTTVDSFGRHLDSFQYEIVPNTSTPISQLPFTDISAVVRGDEINSGHVIPIRNGLLNGSDPNPASGGWGTVRGTVPFTLTGDQLTFAAGFNVLGITNGTFVYRVFTTNYGSTVSSIDSSSIPLPSALPAAVGTVALFVTVGFVRRRFAIP